MSKYMDKEGFLRKEDSSNKKDLRILERMLERHKKNGATVPESIWCVLATLQTAIENFRFVPIAKKYNLPKRLSSKTTAEKR